MYQKQHCLDIIKPITKPGGQMTTEEERKHRTLAEALGMTWKEYLKCNPHLKKQNHALRGFLS